MRTANVRIAYIVPVRYVTIREYDDPICREYITKVVRIITAIAWRTDKPNSFVAGLLSTLRKVLKDDAAKRSIISEININLIQNSFV